MSQWNGIVRLAGLPADFQIVDEQPYKATDLRPARVVYTIQRHKREGICSGCHEISRKIHSSDWVEIRDLSAFGTHVYWHVQRFTVRCSRCEKTLVEKHPLCRERRQFSWRYECFVSRLCEELTNAGVARLESLNDKAVYRIDYELLRMRLERQKLPLELGPDYGMDEVHFRTFHKRDQEKKSICFVTNLICLKHRKVIFNAPGRNRAAAEGCLQGLSPEQRKAARSFATDLHDDFHLAVKEHCPQADIVLDRFHLMKIFNEAMNDFRKRQLQMAFGIDEKRLLHGSNKWLLLTRPENLSESKKGLLDELKALNERIVEALLIRDQFIAFFESSAYDHARLRWYELVELAHQAAIREFSKFLKQMGGWFPLLFNYFKHRTSSGVIEAINHKIKAVRGMAYGYRNLHYFQLKILQRVGFLNSTFVQLA